ncbi:MAG: hypothetical protein A3E83_03555 [Gammaproteobacteria bacterium RIFCSPHIGHO2_12_FULL_41_20]|nr:MAG: hypothetical protein A3E83_03555 [Gammaproteobacteria bacterium RIFCSPHIGHO2_12_FULL_41_20]
MPALIFSGNKLNLSLTYDALTLYPKVEEVRVTGYKRSVVLAVTECNRLGIFAVNQPIHTLTEDGRNINDCARKLAVTVPGFDRTVQREDDDHALYHQDGFQIDNSHFHFKFLRRLTRAELVQIVDILASHQLLSAEERSAFLSAYDTRYQQARAALDRLTLAHNQQADYRAIIALIGTQTDNDILANLHDHLNEPRFAYLHKLADGEASNIYQGTTNQRDTVAPSSQAWMQIEKAITLQMAHNIQTGCSRFTPHVGHERATQLAQTHRFFNLPRRIKSGKATNSMCTALDHGNASELDRKHRKVFGF